MPEISETELEALKYPNRNYSKRLIPVESIEGEEWREIPKTEGMYFASTEGRIKKEILLKSGKFISSLMKPVSLNGRLTIGLTIRKNYVVKTYVARLVLQCFAPPPETPNMVVKFADGDVTNCKLENLSWSSRYSSSQAMMENGSRARKLKTKEYLNKVGKKVFRQVQFSETDYETMRAMYTAGISQIRIAEVFKCTQSFVSCVINGKVV